MSRAASVEQTRGIVLDAGALRALEKHDLKLIASLRVAHRLGLPIRVPAAALAQVWRGGPKSAPLARLLKQPVGVVSVDERAARHIGEFVASLRLTPGMKVDVVDAHVALTTRATKSLVYTIDPSDMLRYGVSPQHISAL